MKLKEEGVPAQEVIAAVKLAIKEANLSLADRNRDLRVSSVKLILHTLATRTAGGHLNFTVPLIGMPVRLGIKATKSDTHEIEINLVPPDPNTRVEVRESPLDMTLVDAIETIRAVVSSTVEGDDAFILRDSKITISFAVTSDGEISIGIDGSLSDEVTHTLVLGLVPA